MKKKPLFVETEATKAGDDLIEILRLRFSDYFLKFTQRNKKFNIIEMELDNILAGIYWAYSRGDWKIVGE